MADESPSAQHEALAAALEAGDEPDEALAARLGLAASEVAAARAARGALAGLLAAPGARPAPAAVVVAGGRVGRLELRSLLGRGGMGEVWRAWDPQAEREVALKLLRVVPGPAERARFEAEGQAAARLRHPGIVTVHEAGTTADGRPYLVMELVEGESLADALRRGPLPTRDAVALGRDLARALDHAHARGVLHRDLKPANVLVGRDGRARLVDFGLARDLLRGRLTATGTVVGTPAYMAPEQAAGRPVDARSDVWGLGATLVAALTGAPPPPPALPADRGLAELVLRCLATDPAARPPDAAAVADALERWLTGGPGRTPGPRLALVGAALALAALGLGALASVPRAPAPGVAAPGSGQVVVDVAKARRAVESRVTSLEAELAGGPAADLSGLAAELARVDPAAEPAARARALAARALTARVERAAGLEVPPGARSPLQTALDLAPRLGLDAGALAVVRADALARAPWAARIPEAAARGDVNGVGLGLERLVRAAGLAPPLPLGLRAELAERLRSAAWEAAGRRLGTQEVTRAFVLLEDGLFYDLAPVGSAGPAVKAIGERFYEALRGERPTTSAREAMAWGRGGMFETRPSLWRACVALPDEEWALVASRPASSARLLEAVRGIPRLEAMTTGERLRLVALLTRALNAPIDDLPPYARAWVCLELASVCEYLPDQLAATRRAGAEAAALLMRLEEDERRSGVASERGLVHALGRALGYVVRGSREDAAACLAAARRGEEVLRARVAAASSPSDASRAATTTLGRYLYTVVGALSDLEHPEADRVEAALLPELERLARGDLDLVDDLCLARRVRLTRRLPVDPRGALAELDEAWTARLGTLVRHSHTERVDAEVARIGAELCDAAAGAADGDAAARWRAEAAALRALE